MRIPHTQDDQHIGGRGTAPRRRWAQVMSAGLLVAALAGPAQAGKPQARPVSNASIGSAVRQHTFTTLDGKPLTLASLKGEVVVVNFWASWCAPCRRELPSLNALNTEIARQGGRVIAVSIDYERSNVERFARKLELTLPILHDGPDGLVKTLDLQHIPYTLVIDRAGNVAYTTSGADEASVAEIGAVTRKLLAKTDLVSQTEQGEPR